MSICSRLSWGNCFQCSCRSRIFQTGGFQPQRRGHQPIIWSNFPKGCMKMKEIKTRRGTRPCAPSLRFNAIEFITFTVYKCPTWPTINEEVNWRLNNTCSTQLQNVQSSSTRSRGGLPLSVFIGVNYLIKFSHCSWVQSSQITLFVKFKLWSFLKISFYVCHISQICLS